jgi:hypothetical protein
MTTGALTASTPWQPAHQRWRKAAALGALWGVAVSAMEAVSLPVEGEGAPGFWPLVEWIAPGWCIVGVGIAALTEFAGAKVERPRVVAVSIVASALAFSGLWSWLYSVTGRSGGVSAMSVLFPHGVDPVAAYAYQAWIVLFYGGLYFVAWRLNWRAERARDLLAQVSMARLRTETLLGATRLELLRGHIEPGLLLRVMNEVERRGAQAGSAADDLLARLVAFLRLAMPAVRSGRSTLAEELGLASAYDDLCADLGPERSRWKVVGEAPHNLPFPALLLLPVLDEIAAASPPPFAGTIRVASSPAQVVVAFEGAAPGRRDWMSADLRYRIRVALSTLHGDAWSMTANPALAPDQPALVIVLRLSPAESEASRGARAGSLMQIDEGMSP